MDIKIRMVSPIDIDEVSRVEALCFPAAEAADKKSFEWRIDTFPESFFIAMDGSNIVGFINGCVTDKPILEDELYHSPSSHNPNGSYQTVFGLDVIPEYRCKGVAAKLMQHLIESAKKNGRNGMVLTCKDRLVHYYEKFGYENKGLSKSTHGGAEWFDMFLKF